MTHGSSMSAAMTLNSEGLEKAQCATSGCLRVATQRIEAGGVGSDHCDDCAEKIRSLSALPPVDGLEVVAELNRIIAEEAADFADAAGHAIEAGERPDLWDREVEVAVHTLSQASSVIAGLTAERDEAIERWEAADGMDGAVSHAIRELLNHHKVPLSAFIDDHVANAIRQRNVAEEAQRKTAGKLSISEGMIEKLQRKLDLLESTVSFVRRWSIEKEGNGTSAEDRLSAIANHPGVKGFQTEDHNG